MIFRRKTAKLFAILLCLALMVASVGAFSGCNYSSEKSSDQPSAEVDTPTDNTPTAPEKPTETEPPKKPEGLIGYPIRLDNKWYIEDAKLSASATAENMGEFLGYDESDGFKSMLEQKWTDINGASEFKASIYEYIPNDNKKNRVILQYEENFYVYEFWQYEIEDEDEEYPVVLLERAVDVGMDDGVLDSSLITETDYFKFASPEDIDGFITFLKYVAENEKYTSDYMSKYIHDSGNFDAETRIIRVTLDDNTYFEYQYNRGANALTFEGGGYILTPVQSTKLLLLLGYMIAFHDIDIGVRFDNKIYFAEYDMFDGATAENVGEFLGYVENVDDFEEFVYNQTYLEFYGEISEASIYRYVSENDDGVERIIIPFGDAFYIYAFYSYVNE